MFSIDPAELQKAQRTDPVTGEIMNMKESSRKLTEDMKCGVRGTTKEMLHEWNQLCIEDGLLY